MVSLTLAYANDPTPGTADPPDAAPLTSPTMAAAGGPVRRASLKLELLLREIVDLGPKTMSAIARNSVACEMDRRRQSRLARAPATTRLPGRLRSIEALRHAGSVVGAVAVFAEAELEVRFLTDEMVRVSWGPATEPLGWARNGADPAGASAVEVLSRADPADGWEVRSKSLCVRIAVDGGLTYLDATGQVVRTELAPLRRGPVRTHRAVLRDGERISGLGEQASPVDLRGTTHRLWNRDPGGAWGPGTDPLYCAIPVLVGLKAGADVLVFFENTHDATVTIDDPSVTVAGTAYAELAFSGGMLRHYVSTGPLPELLRRYSALTGRPPLPPRWALGYHQCRWGYKSESDIREVAGGFAAEGLPLSAVHLDIDYMRGYRVFSIDEERYPDLGALSRELAARGTRVVTIVDPAIREDPDYDVYAEGSAGGFFVRNEDGTQARGTVWPGWAAFPDFTDPDARAWWGSLYERLTAQGVAGIWHDMNEPTSITLWGDRSLAKSTRFDAEGRGGDHAEAHNAYGLLMDRTGYEALERLRPGHRPFVLSRAGWAGLQRWAWNWTADIESSWEGLRQQVATVIGLGLSGVPYSGSDIGGFSGVPSPELFVRWLELSVLQPFCRTHSVLGVPSREPWRFEQPYRSAIGELISLRYRLLPYLYTLAAEAAEAGHPLVRPLAWPAPGDEATGSSPDPRLAAVDDAFLLGDALLVAPVTAEGARRRTVELPSGLWYRLRLTPDAEHPPGVAGSGEAPLGGSTHVTLDAPLGQPVVLVRAGTVLPLDDGWATGAEGRSGPVSEGHEPRFLALHCFPDADGSAVGTLYDDAGDGDGAARRDTFTFGGSGAGPTLAWRRDGGYPAPTLVRVVLHGRRAMTAVVDGAPVEVVSGAGSTSIVECGPFDELTVEFAPR